MSSAEATMTRTNGGGGKKNITLFSEFKRFSAVILIQEEKDTCREIILECGRE